MANPNSSFDELLSTTIQELEPVLFDQILAKNATTATFKEYDAVKIVDGGPTIVIPVEWAENGSYGRYSGADTLNTTTNDVFTAFQIQWKQSSMAIQAHGRELMQNMGRSQRRDLLLSRINNAKSSFENQFNIDCLSDGTATNQITGLQAHIADTPAGVIQGVNRTTYTFAKNATVSAVVSASTICSSLDTVDLAIQSYRGKTKVILADELVYAAYEANVHDLQRVMQPEGKLGRSGFRAYAYKDSELVFEPAVAGMPTNTAYFIDPEVIKLFVHRNRNLVRSGERKAWNQDTQIEFLLWMGNIGVYNYRKLGVFNGS